MAGSSPCTSRADATPDSNGAYWSKYIGNCAVYVAECMDGKIGIPVEWIQKAG